MKYLRRSTMSAAAPLGSPSRKTGRDEAVCTSAMSVGDVVSDVITHAAATSFIHIETFEPTHTSHRMRKVRSFMGSHAEPGSGGGLPGGCWDGAGMGSCSAMRKGVIAWENTRDAAAPSPSRLAVLPAGPHRLLLVAQLGDRARDRGPCVAAHA